MNIYIYIYTYISSLFIYLFMCHFLLLFLGLKCSQQYLLSCCAKLFTLHSFFPAKRNRLPLTISSSLDDSSFQSGPKDFFKQLQLSFISPKQKKKPAQVDRLSIDFTEKLWRILQTIEILLLTPNGHLLQIVLHSLQSGGT